LHTFRNDLSYSWEL